MVPSVELVPTSLRWDLKDSTIVLRTRYDPYRLAAIKCLNERGKIQTVFNPRNSGLPNLPNCEAGSASNSHCSGCQAGNSRFRQDLLHFPPRLLPDEPCLRMNIGFEKVQQLLAGTQTTLPTTRSSIELNPQGQRNSNMAGIFDHSLLDPCDNGIDESLSAADASSSLPEGLWVLAQSAG